MFRHPVTWASRHRKRHWQAFADYSGPLNTEYSGISHVTETDSLASNCVSNVNILLIGVEV